MMGKPMNVRTRTAASGIDATHGRPVTVCTPWRSPVASVTASAAKGAGRVAWKLRIRCERIVGGVTGRRS